MAAAGTPKYRPWRSPATLFTFAPSKASAQAIFASARRAPSLTPSRMPGRSNIQGVVRLRTTTSPWARLRVFAAHPRFSLATTFITTSALLARGASNIGVRAVASVHTVHRGRFGVRAALRRQARGRCSQQDSARTLAGPASCGEGVTSCPCLNSNFGPDPVFCAHIKRRHRVLPGHPLTFDGLLALDAIFALVQFVRY